MGFNPKNKPGKAGRIKARLAIIMAAMFILSFACAGCSAVEQAATVINLGYPEDFRSQFKDTWEINNDFRGYLTLEGTQLGVPVVQGTDNEYYKSHGFDGTEGTGVTYIDSRVDLKSAGNTVIYAPDSAADNVFSELVNYKYLGYYIEHPVITFNNVYRDGMYKIFGIMLAEEGSGTAPCAEVVGADMDTVASCVRYVQNNSIIQAPVDVQPTDSLLVIRTHDYTLLDSYGRPAELFVYARKVRDGENSGVQMQEVAINPSPAIPAIWMEQVVYQQQSNAVNKQIRLEATEWFTPYELELIDDADLDRLLTERKELFGQYITMAETSLSAEEKIFLYESRSNSGAAAVLELDKVHLDMKTKGTEVLTATLSPADETASYVWESSDTDVLTVSGSGNTATVTAKKAGEASVTVTVGELKAVCDVHVKKSSSSSSSASISLNAKSLTLTEGSKSTLTASSSVKKCESSHSSVASCSVSGSSVTVTAKKAGSTTLTVTGSNGATTTCKVTVQKSGISLSSSSMSMTRGDRRTISVTSGTAANWYVNNSRVVQVYITDNGRSAIVEAIGSGNAVITVTTKNGAQASCSVSVREGKLSVSPDDTTMYLGDYRTINVTNGYAQSWITNNSNVIRFVSFNGGKSAKIQAVGTGTASITVTGSDGSRTFCYVTVKSRQPAVSISPSSMTLSIGDIRNINVTGGSASRWRSSNEKVAKIYPVGNGSMAQVEAIGAGSATITVTGSDGSTTKCSVTVRATTPNVAISPSSMSLTVGSMGNIKVTAGSASRWSTSNSSVAEVYEVGDGSFAQVEAKKPGTATITVTGSNGSRTTCVVTVQESTPQVQTLAINKSSIKLNVGESDSIRVISGQAARWYASNYDVVDISMVGDGSVVDVEAKRPGTVTIYAEDSNGKRTSCEVKVYGEEATPTPEITPAPTPEPTPVPTPEPTPVPTPEPTPEPTPVPTPEPTPDPIPEPEVMEEPVQEMQSEEFIEAVG